MTIRRRLPLAAVAAGVLLGHLALVQWLQQQLQPAPDGRAGVQEPARLQVRFVRVLQPRPPQTVTASLRLPAAAAPRGGWVALPVLPPVLAAASAPGGASALSEPPGPGRPTEPAQPAAPPEPATAATQHAAAPPSASASAPAFDWPPSTRLRYRLTGEYRGPIDGSAQVEWLRRGAHYQVFLDVQIGPPFAPLITRQMRSEGRLAADGLRPAVYEERTRVLWRDPFARRVDLGADRVRLPGWRSVPRPAGVQDAVSQFVQLTWRFTLNPALLSTGQVLTVPLALPSGVSDWVYDVGMAQTFHLPSGPVDAVHVQPRRQARPGGDLVAEMWFAPTLQYLPIRILIRQGDGSFVDLMADRLPEQEAASIEPDDVTGGPDR